ncbi:TIGR03086 family metal-binding protein [Streptomyces sp. NPDC048639]|uniref:TIGR03086 family metal-binding protein n=1 Tax=Streptomyces sp. NPDC048639 TaxID=3365581 RepID=UPI0037128E2A
MTTLISERLEAAARQAVPVVRGVDDGRLGDPTPCAEYTVRDLLNHLFHVVVGFQAIAAREDADFTTTPDYLDGDWRSRFADETGRLVAAWGAPGADEGVAGSMNLPARTLGSMALLDLTVHGWDLARATGQEYTPDAESVRTLSALIEEMGPTARTMKVFGEPVAVREGAAPIEVLLASTGRDPGWSPGHRR